MNDAQIWSWIVTIVGVIGWYFVGKKYWWSWFIGLFCQILWFIYATVSSQPAFYISVLLYTAVYSKNLWSWWKEHREKKARKSKILSEGIDLNYLFPEAGPITQKFGIYEPAKHSGTSFPPDVKYKDGDRVIVTTPSGTEQVGFVRPRPPYGPEVCFNEHLGYTCEEYDRLPIAVKRRIDDGN